MLVVTARGGEGERVDANCPKEAPVAIGGGGSVEDKGGGPLTISAPITDRELSGDGQAPTGWRVESEAGIYTAYAICTAVGRSETPEEAEKRAAAEKAAAEQEAGIGK